MPYRDLIPSTTTTAAGRTVGRPESIVSLRAWLYTYTPREGPAYFSFNIIATSALPCTCRLPMQDVDTVGKGKAFLQWFFLFLLFVRALASPA